MQALRMDIWGQLRYSLRDIYIGDVMSILISILAGLGSKLLTAKVIEKVALVLIEQLVKRTSSKVDDKLLNIVKDALSK